MTQNIDRFKFRIWYKPNKETITEAIEFKDGSLLTPCLAITGDVIAFDLDNHKDNSIFEKKDIIIIQCTSLKDKNGKLIYEGDILKINCYSREYINYIYYDKSSFTLQDPKDAFQGLGRFDSFQSEYLEIIGNIYENKEMIDEKVIEYFAKN